jgi:hypothetical protein
MELDWSEQSPHIRTLFRPWQPGDGYDEATIQLAEGRLSLRLPTLLRTFYLAWGRRRDMTQLHNPLLNPDALKVAANTLMFCAENQAVLYWGVPCEALNEADPPVLVTYAGPSGWRVASELDWRPSHAHLSGFLDSLTYLHAFCGGAVHAGATQPHIPNLSASQVAWLEEHWNKARVSPIFFQLIGPDSLIDSTWPTLYVRDGQAFSESTGFIGEGSKCALVAREAEALDEVSQALQINWAERR